MLKSIQARQADIAALCRLYHVRLLVLVLLLSTAAYATEVPSSVLGHDGKLDPARLAAFVRSVEPSLREFPPRFMSKEHRDEVLEATRRVIRELKATDRSTIADQHFLTDIAHTFAMAHNVDLGTGRDAKETFERAIALNPNGRRTNYLFGMFLISTRAYHFDSLPYLQKAYELGQKDALYSIGLLLVHMGEKEKGLNALEAYAKEHPESAHTRRVIQAIKNGDLEMRVQ